ncbi:hypothetical protein ABZ589_31630 [Streptomyces sp. NPDC013313]
MSSETAAAGPGTGALTLRRLARGALSVRRPARGAFPALRPARGRYGSV